jgi:hypothetical protein
MRDYDPISARWLSFDPMLNSGDPNGFTFCGIGDPINFFDPWGLCGKSGNSQAGSLFQQFPGTPGTGYSLNQFYAYAGQNPIGWDNFDKYFHSQLSQATKNYPFGAMQSWEMEQGRQRGYISFWQMPIDAHSDGRGTVYAMDPQTLVPLLLMSFYGEAMEAPMATFGRTAPEIGPEMNASALKEPLLLGYGNTTTRTLSQVRALRGTERWQAGEVFVRQVYGSTGQRFFQVPTTGGRFVDAPVNIPSGIVANEVKTYQNWRTVNGLPQQQFVPLSNKIRQQILKDVYLRRNVQGFEPRWIFLDAPPSSELATYLTDRRIMYIIYR